MEILYSQGTITGGLLGLSMSMWMSIGAYITEPDVMDYKPVSIDGCAVSNETFFETQNTTISEV